MGEQMQTMMDLNPNDLPRPTVPPSDAYEVIPCQDYVGQETEGLECAFLTLPQSRVRATDFKHKLFVVRLISIGRA